METSGAGDAAFWISNAQLLHRLPGRITFKKSDVVFLISPPARLKDEQVFASFPSIRNFYTLQWRYTLEDCCIYRVILFQQMYDVGVRLLVTVSACYALKWPPGVAPFTFGLKVDLGYCPMLTKVQLLSIQEYNMTQNSIKLTKKFHLFNFQLGMTWRRSTKIIKLCHFTLLFTHFYCLIVVILILNLFEMWRSGIVSHVVFCQCQIVSLRCSMPPPENGTCYMLYCPFWLDTPSLSHLMLHLDPWQITVDAIVFV